MGWATVGTNVCKILFAGTLPLLVACTGKFELKRSHNAAAEQKLAAKLSDANCIDPDLTKLDQSQTLTLCDGALGRGTLTLTSPCTADGQVDCVTGGNFAAIDTTSVSPSDLAGGKTAGGIIGTMRETKQCRNLGNLANFDSSAPANLPVALAAANMNSATTDIINFTDPHGLVNDAAIRVTTTGALPPQLAAGTPYYVTVVTPTTIRLAATIGGPLINFTSDGVGNHTFWSVANGVLDDFDTMSGSASATTSPWSSDYVCGTSNFTNISSEIAPTGTILPGATSAFSQVWRDELSGTIFTNVLNDGTNVATTWADAVTLCASINGTSAGTGWYLPTQKEMTQLYINGVDQLVVAGGTFGITFWTSTTRSIWQGTAWNIVMGTGFSSYWTGRPSGSTGVICVK